ncbi:MAG: DUF5916 domain-containing protein [Pseudohongiellaceae bacterium]|nr:DUF5916 domain-containing protein [Pseudohongiellaceae bacterium]
MLMRSVGGMFCLAVSTAVVAQNADYEIPRTQSAPIIDGRVEAQEWAGAQAIELAFETSPSENVPAIVKTQALIMEDGEQLYVAFIAQDPRPEEIRAYYRDRDNIRGTDYVGILVDTFNDESRSFEFIVSALGVQFDATNDDLSGSYDSSWNALWDSAGTITETGYMTEMAIPFDQLRFVDSEQEKTWGIRFVRDYPRDRRYRFDNVERDRSISCWACQFSKISGMANVTPGRNLEITPTLTSSALQSRANPALDSWESPDVDFEAGVDVRWGVTQDMVLNATVNPDFSQVEADSAQLDVNNTFSLYYPEKRNFFLDGADYFNTQVNMVHTRNIADPDYGVKLTGKSGSHSYGFLQANDTRTSFLIPSNERSSLASLGEVDSDVSILRYRQDVLANSSVGALLTHRSAGSYENTVMSLDGKLRLTQSDVVNLQVMRSETNYPLAIQDSFAQDEKLDDDAYLLEYRRNDRQWDVWLQHINYGEDFRADLGFISRVDYERNTARVGRTWRYGSERFFDRVRVALDWDETYDQDGLKLEEETEVFFEMDGPMQSSIDGLIGKSKTYFNGQYFDEQFNQVSLSIRPSSALFMSMTVRLEDVVDFDNTRLGESLRINPRINYQAGRHLQLDLSHNHQEFDVSDGRLFTADITELRSTYQFSVRSFVRLIVQYRDTERDPSLYVRPKQSRSKKLLTQLLYSYKLNPQTLFHIGYSDDGFQDDSLNSIETSSRALFAKFSYSWQP